MGGKMGAGPAPLGAGQRLARVRARVRRTGAVALAVLVDSAPFPSRHSSSPPARST